MQKSCDLGAHFADLEKQIQLNLDLELAKTNLQKAKDEAAGMKNLSTDLFLNRVLFPFSEPSVISFRNNEPGSGKEGFGPCSRTESSIRENSTRRPEAGLSR